MLPCAPPRPWPSSAAPSPRRRAPPAPPARAAKRLFPRCAPSGRSHPGRDTRSDLPEGAQRGKSRFAARAGGAGGARRRGEGAAELGHGRGGAHGSLEQFYSRPVRIYISERVVPSIRVPIPGLRIQQIPVLGDGIRRHKSTHRGPKVLKSKIIIPGLAISFFAGDLWICDISNV